jgi:uncharacterized membrane protein YeaQ/YmgE (transglycosylase-associated protein family)
MCAARLQERGRGVVAGDADGGRVRRPTVTNERTSMGCLISVIIGAAVGWLASIAMETNPQMGWIANVLVGMAGSALGHFIAGLLGITSTNRIGRMLIAIAGAALLIFILRWCGLFGPG